MHGEIQTADCAWCGVRALCEVTEDDLGEVVGEVATCAQCLREREPDAIALEVMPLFDPGPAPIRGQLYMDA